MNTDRKRPWDGIVSEEEQRATRRGFGRPGGRAASGLLIIDVQYRTVGTTPKPLGSDQGFPRAAARSAGTR